MEQRGHGYRSAFGITLAVAFVWCWICGNRGLFPLDQSIVLDGAWRIASGQTPFVDFTTPHGLTIMGLQAIVFRLFGPGYDVYVGFAAFLNVVATGLAMLLVGRLLPGRPGLTLLGGLLTAIWFYPVFGTPYSEQTAFLLSLAGLVAIVDGARRPLTVRVTFLFGAGMLAGLAFLSKQNAGGLFLLVYAVAVLLVEDRRPVALVRASTALAGGFLAVATAFAVWLVTVSDPLRFRAAYFEIPSGELSRRADLFDLLVQPWFGAGRGPTKLVLMIWLFVALVVLVRRRVATPPEILATGVLGATLIVYQNLFNLTTINSGENGFAFTGIATALVLGFAFSKSLPARTVSPGTRLGKVAAALLVLVLLARGVEIGWSRTVHDSMANAAFTERLDRDRWRQLRWPATLDLFHGSVAIADTRGLIEWLKRDDRDFLVFPDSTWLYAALERPSPQPILWFDPGLTYPADEDPSRGDEIVRSLEKHGIEVLVLERQTYMGPYDTRLNDFPRFAEFVKSEFAEVARFGNYVVMERDHGARRAAFR